MRLQTKTGVVDITEPTIRFGELDGLQGLSVWSIRQCVLEKKALTEGAWVIADAILEVGTDALPYLVTRELLKARKPRPRGLPGHYGVNSIGTGRNGAEFLYRSWQKDGIRQRKMLGRIRNLVAELASHCEQATNPDDDAARLIIPASLLLRHTPPSLYRPPDPAKIDASILIFIKEFVAKQHRSPSITEVAAGVGIARSTAHKHIHHLAQDKRLTIEPAKHQTLRVR